MTETVAASRCVTITWTKAVCVSTRTCLLGQVRQPSPFFKYAYG
jgi:hypothetical protein